jgi:biotin carboxyl carrier protein
MAALQELVPRGAWGGGWRPNAVPSVRLRHDAEERSVAADSADHPDAAVAVDPIAGSVHVEVDGQSLVFDIAAAPTVDEAIRHAAAHDAGHASLVAPMPGRVIAIRVAEGASVPAHATLVVIEAMKMEHAVATPMAGTVTRLLVREGQQVGRGDLLAEVSA